jgi:hypothetical protein
MPRTPDASSVTRLRAIQSSSVAGPTSRSASYVPTQPGLLYSLRTSDAGRGMFPGQSYLSSQISRRYVNPRHQGFLTGPPLTESPPTFPVVTITLESGVDFTLLDAFNYDFEENLPPGPDFDAIFVAGTEPPTNIQDIKRINIGTTDNSEGFENTTISTSPEWPGATQTVDPFNQFSRLAAPAGTFPGINTILQFRNVPVIANIRIQIYGDGD